MMGIERNRANYNNVSQIQKNTALSEQWQKQSGNNTTELKQAKQSFLEQKNKLQNSKKLSKSSQVRRTQSVEAVDAISGIDGVEGINGDLDINAKTSFENAGRFDMKHDIVDFVRPKSVNPEYLSKDSLNKAGKNIMAHLEMVGASEGLLKRADTLLQEEHNVKSVTDAYRNALIFA
ncbi:MAG: hypothetical protein ACJARD_001668 [Alphaproteobacteria bacterium]|jgi:hypothetical protein